MCACVVQVCVVCGVCVCVCAWQVVCGVCMQCVCACVKSESAHERQGGG